MRSELLNIPINPAKIKSGHIEKDFQLQVMTYLRKRDWYCFKIPDVWLGTRLLDGYHITPEWDQFLIEYKKTTGFTFNMSQFEPSQIFLLEWMTEHNAEAYVMVYSTKTNTYWVGTYSYLKTHQNERWGIKLF
jgi:hypothetical protein